MDILDSNDEGICNYLLSTDFEKRIVKADIT
jgi:hypothetical protein